MQLSPIVDHAYFLNVTPDQHHAEDHKARHQKDGADDLESLLCLANFSEKSHLSLTNVTTSQHHTKTVASELNLADMAEKAHGSLTGIGANDHHAQSHTLASHSTKAHSELTGVTASQHHTKTVASELNLADMAEKAHGSLTGIGANDHHAQSHTLASHSTKAHSELTGVTASQHHTKTVASELNLADMAEKSHLSLTNVTAAQHHAKYLDTEAVVAVSAGNLTKLVVETNTLVADGGKVGVGTATPDEASHVNGLIQVTGGADNYNSEQKTLIFSRYGRPRDRHHYISAKTYGEAGVPADNYLVFYIDDGTTTDGTSHVNTLKLDGAGNISCPGTIDGVDISAHAVNVSAHHVKYTNAEVVAAVSAGNLTKLVVETNTLVADGGKVGIGTPSPIGILHVHGGSSDGTVPQFVISGGVAGGAIANLYVVDSKSLATGLMYAAKAFGINIQNQVSATNFLLQRTVWGGATGAAAIVLHAYPDGHFSVWTSPSGSSAGTVLTEKLRVSGNGDVSILTGNLAMAASKTVDGVDISAHAANVSAHHVKASSVITFNLGLATVGTKQAQALIPGTLTISKVKIYADTAPVGASLIVDINKNGTTIFTTQANRPAIPSGGHADDSGTPNITSLAEGDRLSVDVDQVGSTTPGGNDLLVTIIC